jgi:CheY-like chemotaxis protein
LTETTPESRIWLHSRGSGVLPPFGTLLEVIAGGEWREAGMSELRDGSEVSAVKAEPVLDRPIVVIADDDSDLRRLVAAAARREGFRVLQAADGPALARVLRALALHDQRPAVVLTDVHMPGCDGLDALVETRALAPGVPVLMMTACGDDHTRARATSLGAARVLDKPLDLRALQRLLRVFAPA